MSALDSLLTYMQAHGVALKARAAYVEAKHPRKPKGDPKGGKWRIKPVSLLPVEKALRKQYGATTTLEPGQEGFLLRDGTITVFPAWMEHSAAAWQAFAQSGRDPHELGVFGAEHELLAMGVIRLTTGEYGRDEFSAEMNGKPTSEQLKTLVALADRFERVSLDYNRWVPGHEFFEAVQVSDMPYPRRAIAKFMAANFKAYDEAKHPRKPKGDPQAGEWRAKPGIPPPLTPQDEEQRRLNKLLPDWKRKGGYPLIGEDAITGGKFRPNGKRGRVESTNPDGTRLLRLANGGQLNVPQEGLYRLLPFAQVQASLGASQKPPSKQMSFFGGGEDYGHKPLWGDEDDYGGWGGWTYTPPKPIPPPVATDVAAWLNPASTAVYAEGGFLPAMLNGVLFSEFTPSDWSQMEGHLEVSEPPLTAIKPREYDETLWDAEKKKPILDPLTHKPVTVKHYGVPNLHPAAGVIIEEPDGRIWTVLPRNEYGGYKQTFPKGTIDAGQSMQDAALREAWEESGLRVVLTGILGDFEGDTSMTRYYTARRAEGTPSLSKETWGVALSPLEDLAKSLNRPRDQAILNAIRARRGLALKAYDETKHPRKPKGDPLAGQWIPKPERYDVFEAAINEFGLTDNPREAGYVLPDGRMLDFSGRSQTGEYRQTADKRWVMKKPGRDYMANQRSIDHREIALLWGDEGALHGQDGIDGIGGTEAMMKFAALGAMRVAVMDGGTMIDLYAPPSDAQKRFIAQFVREGVQIDVTDPLTQRTLKSFEVTSGITLAKALRFAEQTFGKFFGLKAHDPSRARAQEAGMQATKAYQEVQHPRAPKGHPQAGEWVDKPDVALEVESILAMLGAAGGIAPTLAPAVKALGMIGGGKVNAKQLLSFLKEYAGGSAADLIPAVEGMAGYAPPPVVPAPPIAPLPPKKSAKLESLLGQALQEMITGKGKPKPSVKASDPLFGNVVAAAKTINFHLKDGQFNMDTLAAFQSAVASADPNAWYTQQYAPAIAAIQEDIGLIGAGQADKVKPIALVKPAVPPAGLAPTPVPTPVAENIGLPPTQVVAPAPPPPPPTPLVIVPAPSIVTPMDAETLLKQKGEATALMEKLVTGTGKSQADLMDALTQPASIQFKERALTRAAVENALWENGWERPDALIDVMNLHDSVAVQAHVASIADGAAAQRAVNEFANTPLYDVQTLSAIHVADTEVHGQASCDVVHRSLNMGSTSVTGDFRHELGHAVQFALGGGGYVKGAGGHVFPTPTPLTQAIDAHYAGVRAKMQADPSGDKTKLTHEWYEKNYGIIGRRGADNQLEDFAEHYRGYHREVFRTRTGQTTEVKGGGASLDTTKYSTRIQQYRGYHPEMARIMDAHYTAAWLALTLGKG